MVDFLIMTAVVISFLGGFFAGLAGIAFCVMLVWDLIITEKEDEDYYGGDSY